MFGDILENAILYSHINRNGNIHIGIFETFTGGEYSAFAFYHSTVQMKSDAKKKNERKENGPKKK